MPLLFLLLLLLFVAVSLVFAVFVAAAAVDAFPVFVGAAAVVCAAGLAWSNFRNQSPLQLQLLRSQVFDYVTSQVLH